MLMGITCTRCKNSGCLCRKHLFVIILAVVCFQRTSDEEREKENWDWVFRYACLRDFFFWDFLPSLKLGYSFFVGILVINSAQLNLERGILQLVKVCLYYHALQNSRGSGLMKQWTSFYNILLFLCLQVWEEAFFFFFSKVTCLRQ